MKTRILVGLASFFLLGCIGQAPRAFEPICRISGPEIDEPSGLVQSQQYPGVFWTHNDSGDSPRFFAVTSDCQLLAEFTVENAQSHDWEDIAIDNSGNLYIGDFGNNFNVRRNQVVYRIPEPNPYGEDLSVHADLAIPFSYADQKVFLPLWKWNFDAEAMFWMDGALHILTKHRSDGKTQRYLLTADGGPLEPAASFDLYFSLAGNVTGADLHSDGRMLAVLTYRAVYLFLRSGMEGAPFREVRRIDLPSTDQVESIAWDGVDLIFGNEERYLFRIPNALTRP